MLRCLRCLFAGCVPYKGSILSRRLCSWLEYTAIGLSKASIKVAEFKKYLDFPNSCKVCHSSITAINAGSTYIPPGAIIQQRNLFVVTGNWHSWIATLQAPGSRSILDPMNILIMFGFVLTVDKHVVNVRDGNPIKKLYKCFINQMLKRYRTVDKPER